MAKSLNGETIRNTIGKKIRLLRELNDITQIELAKAIGMKSTGAISQIENGSKGIKLQAIIRAADVLGVHPIVFLDMNGMTPDELKLMVNMMKLIKKRRESAGSVEPHFDAIKKILSD